MNSTIKMLIVFEGLDGVGKTTLAKRFAEENSFCYIKIPPPEYNDIRIAIEKNGSPLQKYNFYLNITRDVINKASKDRTIVIDRYIYSSIIAYARDSNKDCAKEFFAGYKDIVSSFPMPDAVFYIKCNNDIRLERIKNRKKSEAVIEDNISDDFFNLNIKYYDKMMSMGKNWFVIDNTHSLDKALKKINDKMEIFK